MEEIVRMQENLLLIRRAVGWTASRFGDKIGVTRQTINNIESGRCKLNKTQYIAMRSVLDAEINSSPNDTKMLQTLLDVLVDNPQNYSEEVREKVKEKANIMTPGILVGSVSREAVSNEWMNVVASVLALTLPAPVAAVGLVYAGSWLLKTVKNSINGKNNGKASSDISAEEKPTEETIPDTESADNEKKES